MKKCCNCKETLDDSAFNKRKFKTKIGLQSMCKKCSNSNRSERYHKFQEEEVAVRLKRRKSIRKWFDEYKKTLKCERCPENNPICLDFHHNDSTKKEYSISNMMSWSKESIMKEVEKCSVLCANCHRKEHANI